MEVRLNYREGKLYTDLSPLIEQALEVTELTADVAAAGASLTVRDIDGFAVNNILVLGEFGTETCEIVKTHATTAPTGTTITLVAGGVEFAHSAGTKIYLISYNQIELSHSATVGGAKSVLATVAVQADELEQPYLETAQSSGYYFARFKNDISATYSTYSPAVPYGGFADNTVGYAVNWALHRNGMKAYDNEVTRQFIIDEVNDCLRYWQGKLKRWPKYLNENTDIGTLTAGTSLVALPTDIYDAEANQSLIALRLGSGAKLEWYDPIEFEELKYGENKTAVYTQATSGSTTLVVDDAGDFADDGSLDFYVSGTRYSITYTSVNRSTNTFSGIPASGTGSISVTVAVDTPIYQGATFGTPTRYSIRGGYVDLDPIPGADDHQLNVYADYWALADEVNDEGDTLDMTRFHAVKYWLAWKIRMQKKNDGMLDYKDGFFMMFKEVLSDAIRTLPKSMTFKSRPFRRWGVTD